MNTTTFNKSLISSAVSAALFISANTLAAEQQHQIEAEEGKLERIEVTANRRSQSIQDVPYNISAVSGAELEDAGIVDSSELMRNVAGITVVDRGYRNSGAVNGIIIRGVNVDGGANGDVALSAVPTVASYINDTPMYANFILKDIEMVEVLRGPQGTLYGSGSLAGTVKYLMNRPDTDFFYGSASANLSQTEGSEGFNLNTDVMVNLPITDNFAVRANLGKIDNDGIVDYTNVYNLDDNSRAPVGAFEPANFDPNNGFVPTAGYNPPAIDGDVATGTNTFRSVEDADTVDITYGRISTFWQATDELSFLLSHQFQNDEIGGRRQVTRGTNWVDGTEQHYNDYENGAVILEPSDRDVSLTALEVEWDLGFATLTSSSSEYSHEGSSLSDNTGFYAKNSWFSDLYYGTPRPLAVADRSYKEEAFIQELRLVSNERRANIDWVVGAYYMDQDTLSTQDSYMPGYQEWAFSAFNWWPTMQGFGMAYTDNDFHYVRNQNFKDKALFGELTYHFSDKLRATVGMRYFDNEFTNDTVLALPIWPNLTEEPYFETSENDVLFKGNISYNLTEETMIYTTYSEGYRRGGANAVPLSGDLAERSEWQQYKADMATNYEFGVKGYLGEGAHSYTASAFLIDWDDPQLNTATTWGFFSVANGESAQTAGVEFELQGYLTDELRYTLGYAYVRAELTADLYVPSSIAAENPLSLQAKDGDKLPSTPENTLSASIDYTHTLDNGMYWITLLSAYYQSDSLNYLGESEKLQADIDGFSIWNLSSRLNHEDWDVTLYVSNLFNEDGVTGTIPEGYMGTEPSQNFLGNSSKDYISRPRTIGINALYRF
ncbi:TonB-dependent receptor [Pseudoalteromonas sp. MB41]|uniref:TonB-dependent receptor n=1 Tax=Pseudoalteromonas sp. MB41 TaxID=2896366 RepID=UPI001E48E0C9|nr:TonB-dependent receptor [Pseudoalteromonas sp. MB41]MCC9662094.1 TonB-dependent receptor [Pseudoalteromonas sp. MB41]